MPKKQCYNNICNQFKLKIISINKYTFINGECY